jgi:hypothetical protein
MLLAVLVSHVKVIELLIEILEFGFDSFGFLGLSRLDLGGGSEHEPTKPEALVSQVIPFPSVQAVALREG